MPTVEMRISTTCSGAYAIWRSGSGRSSAMRRASTTIFRCFRRGPISLPLGQVCRPTSSHSSVRNHGRSFCAGLTLEEGALPLDSPAIARESTIVADDPVARNGHGNRVRSAGPSDRTGRLGRADALGDLRVARRRTGRDLTQRLPDSLLKGGAAHIEWEIEPKGWSLDKADNPGDELLELQVAAGHLGIGEAILEIANQGF